mmetsp:Transcript_10854/g.14777  ORF Transcript_10854/g.14777 Transcript_10854/m.14777 type:complete len:259 (+) Transcript_10854:110-886(+)
MFQMCYKALRVSGWRSNIQICQSHCVQKSSIQSLITPFSKGNRRGGGPRFSKTRPSAHRMVRANGQQSFSTEGGSADSETRVYVNYTIYKGKSALAVSLIKPRFKQQGSYINLEKAGGVMLEIAHAVGERQYDWTNKQKFQLSPVEALKLISEAPKGCKFFHDPNMGKAGQGTVAKMFAASPMPDGNGYFLNLNVKSSMGGGSSSTMSVPIALDEFEALKSIIQYSVPHLLGFSAVFNPEMASVSSDQYENPGTGPMY